MIHCQSKNIFGWLTGNEIIEQVNKGRINIKPFTKEQVNPNSYNYRLDSTICRLQNEVIDLKIPDVFEEITLSDEGYLLYPDECYLGCTMEEFGSDYYASLITGRSSIGRKFITNHMTAGLIDQGFNGKITLEITVQKPTRIYPGVIFGQIFWFTTVGDANLYCGKYVSQSRPTASKIHLDFNNDS